MDRELKDSQNNSAVISRISAVFGTGTPSCGKVSDGETGRGKCMSQMVDRGNPGMLKTGFLSFLAYSSPHEWRFASQ
jgi:hypothetical protein